MTRLAILVSAAALCLVACGSPGSTPEASMPNELTPAPSLPLPDTSGKPGASGGTTITGVLAWNDVEGGCLALQAPDGSYEVIYPEGWVFDRTAGVLHGPAGESVPLGGEVTVTGAVDTGMASICQIGQIFVATEVDAGTP